MLTTPTPKATSSVPSPANSRRVPLDKRKRTETSCDKCKSRKQKCRKEPGQDACRYCIQHNIECQTTQPRKKRLYGSVESLGNRLNLLESLVKGLLPEADVSNLEEMRQLGISLGIALPDSPGGDADGEQANPPGGEGEEPMSLLPDQQGQVQYIGPSSSFSFHLKLRALCGQESFPSFVLFGKNAADQAPAPRDAEPPCTSSVFASDYSSSADEAAMLETLVGPYFEHINPDFPVLYEPSFREAYEGWLAEPVKADLAWQCSFLCVLLLARRVARVSVTEEKERLWWKHIQTLLPVVIFTSSMTAVQALMLAAIHLHNTNHRDACWNLTGTAIRIAFAIGLHQDKASTSQAPLARELRKRLWWTLYAFEQMQVSSYDRPSAIEHHVPMNNYTNERIVGTTAHSLPDYSRWFDRLVVHLSSACRAPKHTKTTSGDESYAGPLSPAAGVLRDLERWRHSLPQHLRIDVVDTAAPASRRPLLLLHALYHYTVTVLCRSALLARATLLSKEDRDSDNIALIGMSDSCTTSGRALANILLKLEAIGKFNAITWWDVWYSLAAGSVLILDLMCQNKMGAADSSESRILLSQLAGLSRSHLRNPNMPGTISKFASLIPELHTMAESMMVPQASPAMPKGEVRSGISEPVQVGEALPPQPQVAPFAYSHPNANNGAYIFADNMPARYYPQADYSTGTPYSNTRYDRSTQMQFMDFTVNGIHEWNWGDMGNLLGPGGAPGHHATQTMPPQAMPPGLPPGSAPGPYSCRQSS
ncbi:hypothetical protein BU23DRAFT_598560 [Bimuria novae-zelandiae CBS 107.79]|uniref:Zn(2)-C6 fungal-type domain-containing protein n=1 Tax=Bimuria novae-zelandiae CBS 107.79 TaxID=1447943 RepID=A0A6A5VFW9_9PLEO|nr:hypothetical protein BU23DRAFT_598560 [Bimuria novae-zelandiae CBS 107.79]